MAPETLVTPVTIFGRLTKDGERMDETKKIQLDPLKPIMELRGGTIYKCTCGKRDGLQDYCWHADSPKHKKLLKNKDIQSQPHEAAATDADTDSKEQKKHHRLPFRSDRNRNFYIMKGREGYIDHPPLPPYSFKPCLVHSQPYF